MIVKMSKLTLLGMEDQRKALIGSLMEFGAVEISAVNESEYEDLAHHPIVQEDISAIEGKMEDVRASLESINKHCPEKKGLFHSRREINESEYFETIEQKEQIWAQINAIKEQEERLVQLKAEENRLNNTYLSLLPWSGLSEPLHTLGTQKTVFQLGTIPAAADWDMIVNEMGEKAPYSTIECIHSDKDQYYVYVLFHKDMEQECLSVLKSRGYNRVVFHGLKGTTAENIERLKNEITNISKQRENAIEQIRSLKDARRSMEILYDGLCMERGRISAAGKVLKTEKTFLIKGWIPENLAEQAKVMLESKYTVSIEIVEPAEDEEFPVLLENRGIAEAGEPVSNMYSLPNSLEIDPNPVMAPFFVMFFGLMLSDGGYGVIMVLLAGFVLRQFKLENSMRKFMKLILYCGIATVFWGFLFGGWFGVEALAKYGVWLNPIEQPELLLSWSLLFGVIHMYAGFGLKAANLIRQKKYLDVVFDVLFVYIFYTGFILVLLPYVPEIDKAKAVPFVNVGKYLFVAGAILLLLTQGRDRKNIFSKLIGGLSSLYGVVGFMSDILSYSRLLALGLATGIIASIVNQMSVMFDFNIIIKILLAAIILVIGHTINFAINALGAYVHSCRLQYLEFFGKFFTGGGKPFKPLRANTKYVVVKTDIGN